MLTLIPLAIMAVALGLILTMRTPRDLAIAVAIVPWAGGLTTDIGVNLAIHKILFAVLALKYAGSLDPWRSPLTAPLMLLFAVGFTAAAMTLTGTALGMDEYVGGAMRNGMFRVMVTGVNIALIVLPAYVIFGAAARGRVQAMDLLRVLVASTIVMCLVGLVQFLTFLVSGIDIIPIGILTGNDYTEDQAYAFGRTATLVVGGQTVIRASSFAGEPKSFGMLAALLVTIVIALGPALLPRALHRQLAIAVGLAAAVASGSTSAFIALVAGVGIAAIWRIGRVFLATTGLGLVYFGGAAALALVMIANAHQFDVGNVISANPSFGGFIYSRTIGRINVEDFDVVILRSMIADPIDFVLGKGLGLAHLNTSAFIPDYWRHYMHGRILSPKTGVTYFLDQAGVIGLALLATLSARLTPARRGLPNPVAARYQSCAVAAIAVMFLRIYMIEVVVVLGALVVLAYAQARAAYAAPGLASARLLPSRGPPLARAPFRGPGSLAIRPPRRLQ